jgi:S-(hydroxymethyl)glutathione dehydrogenase/alcohol dehydrogenase
MKAAVLEQISQPLAIRDLEIPPLQPGQVLVKIICTGICGSQLQEIDGIKGDPAHLPHLLGHEGCGVVEAVDNVVTTVKPGDKVVMHWRKGEGCDVDGAVYGNVKSGAVTTFSEYSIVSENRVTSIPHDIPNDFAALLGCALSTAVSIVENEAKPKIGDVVSVIGCGGLGLSIIFALTMRKAELWEVVGIDSVESKKKLVERFYSRMTRFSTQPVLSDIVIDTIGSEPIGTRYISLQKNGTSAGGFEPAKDIPRYVEMFRHGTFYGYEKIITHRIPLDQINEGIQLMRDGKAGRVMIEMDK